MTKRKSWILAVGLCGWSCLGVVQPASETRFAAAEPGASEREDDNDAAHMTLRMIREPTPAWIPKAVEEIPAARAADEAAMNGHGLVIVQLRPYVTQLGNH